MFRSHGIEESSKLWLTLWFLLGSAIGSLRHHLRQPLRKGMISFLLREKFHLQSFTACLQSSTLIFQSSLRSGLVLPLCDFGFETFDFAGGGGGILFECIL